MREEINKKPFSLGLKDKEIFPIFSIDNYITIYDFIIKFKKELMTQGFHEQVNIIINSKEASIKKDFSNTDIFSKANECWKQILDRFIYSKSYRIMYRSKDNIIYAVPLEMEYDYEQ